jgi:hypothetical protein
VGISVFLGALVVLALHLSKDKEPRPVKVISDQSPASIISKPSSTPIETKPIKTKQSSAQTSATPIESKAKHEMTSEPAPKSQPSQPVSQQAAKPDSKTLAATSLTAVLGTPDQKDKPATATTARKRKLRAKETRGTRRLRLMKKARRMIRRKEYRQAREHLTKALEIRDDYWVRRMLCWSHELAGELWPAAYHLKRAIAKAPFRRVARDHSHLGIIFFKIGKRKQACQAFRTALRIWPSTTSSRKNLAYTKRHVEKHCG